MTDEELREESKLVGAVTSAGIIHFDMEELREFARRIAEIEREECAKVAADERIVYSDAEWRVRCDVAAVIRERGQQ